MLALSGDIKRASRKQSLKEQAQSPKKIDAISRFGEYLKSYYNRSTIHSDDKLCIAPCTQFIDLMIVQQDSHKIHASSKGKDLAGVKNNLQLDDVVTPDSRFVYVEGPPGYGKSTLCCQLCRKWDTLKSLKRYKIVLHLKLRERRVHNATKLSEIFFHHDEDLSHNVVREVLKCEGDGVLLILDGFDEMPITVVRDQRSIIMSLISGHCLPKGHILLTSRPSTLHHMKHLPTGYRSLQIHGFNIDCMLQYMKNVFEPEMLHLVFSNPVTYSLMCIPINCAIIAKVYKEIESSGRQMPKTTTQLYTILILVLIKRHMISKGEWDEFSRVPTDLEGLPSDIIADLKKVSELAYCRHSLPEGAQLVFTDDDVGEGFQHLGLLIETKEMYVCEGAKSYYSFPHLSIQEFLAAWHVTCNRTLMSGDFFTDFNNSSLNAFWQFLAGLLHDCNVFPLDCIARNIQAIVRCLYEAQNSCKSLEGYKSPHYICTPFITINPIDLYAFGYVLARTSLQWDLHLGYCSRGMSHLVNSLKNASNTILGTISKLTVRTFEWAPDSLLRLEELPTCLLEQIGELDIQCYRNVPVTQPILKLFSSLCHLHTFTLYGLCLPDGSHLLLQAIRSSKFRNFCFVFDFILTVEEINELSECIAASSTLEHFKLLYEDRSDDDDDDYSENSDDCCVCFEEVFGFSAIVKAALSCSTLKALSTNIPFPPGGRISNNLESIEFKYSPHAVCSLQALFDCLCYIADMCKMPSMRSLEVTVDIPPIFDHAFDFPDLDDTFLVILNRSLHSNGAFANLDLHLHLSSNYQRCTFSQSLQTHPSLLLSRSSVSLSTEEDTFEMFSHSSDSLCDFSTEEDTFDSEPDDTTYTDCIFYPSGYPVPEGHLASFRIGKKCQSCPDLSQMQALHHIHPLLRDALGTGMLYYNSSNWDVYRILYQHQSAN